MERLPIVSVVQVGYRSKLDDNFSVATNFMYRSQIDLPDNIALNFKVIVKNKLWLGGGRRVSYANKLQIGVLFNCMRIAYIYEMPRLFN